MSTITTTSRSHDNTRERVIFAAFACVTVAMGVIGTSENPALVIPIAMILISLIAAATIPCHALVPVLAALLPFQIYFFAFGSSLTWRVALIFLVIATVRVLIGQGVHASLRPRMWIVTAALYLFTALIAALDAPNKYVAFKGIYDWLVVFAALFVTAQTVRSSRAMLWAFFILVAGGVVQAVLGLLEYGAGLDKVTRVLQAPIAEFFLQPNLLRERLPFLSFNWVTDARVLPFGTFINAIDYSIFLAALTMLALTLALSRPRSVESFVWFASATIMTLALLLTFKASGLLALVGGALVLSIFWMPRFSRRMIAIAAMLFLFATIFAAFFSDTIVQRATFLIQREQNQSLMTGRAQIWLRLAPAFVERPLFGYGLNNADAIAEPTRTLQNGVFGLNPTAPESSYVGTLVETGALGFIALMSFFAVALNTAYRRARDGTGAPLFAGVLAALAAILIGNLTVSGFTTDQNGMLMGVLIGLVFAEWKNQ